MVEIEMINGTSVYIKISIDILYDCLINQDIEWIRDVNIGNPLTVGFKPRVVLINVKNIVKVATYEG